MRQRSLRPKRQPMPSRFAAILNDKPAALRVIREEIGDCTRCKLSQGRTNIVFGVGDPQARIMFVGEGPGADEDAQGEPFVGRAGQLLNNMIHRHGDSPRRRLHRQRGEVPPAAEPRSGAR